VAMQASLVSSDTTTVCENGPADLKEAEIWRSLRPEGTDKMIQKRGTRTLGSNIGKSQARGADVITGA
jgi:hypothetical protein